ncbi:MAG: hypothetical protein WAK82_15320 [Streptosporangiaceae bacterium]
MPEMLRRSDHERVRAEFLGGGGEFPGWASAPRAYVHIDLGVPGHLIEFGEQPALQCFGVPEGSHHLPGQRLAVDAG